MRYIHTFLGNGITEHYFYDESSSNVYVVLWYDDEYIEDVMYCLGNINSPNDTEECHKDYNLPTSIKYVEYDNRNDFKNSLLDNI